MHTSYRHLIRSLTLISTIIVVASESGAQSSIRVEAIPLPEGVTSLHPFRMTNRGDILALPAATAEVPEGFGKIYVYKKKSGWTGTPIPAGYKLLEIELEINSKGLVAGALESLDPEASQPHVPFILKNGKLSFLTPPAGANIQGVGRINKKGEFFLSNFAPSTGIGNNCLLYSRGIIKAISVPTEDRAYCDELNDRGVIAGSTLIENKWRLFIYDQKNKKLQIAPPEVGANPKMITNKGSVFVADSILNSRYESAKNKNQSYEMVNSEQYLFSMSDTGVTAGYAPYYSLGIRHGEALTHAPNGGLRLIRDFVPADAEPHNYVNWYGFDIDPKGKKILLGVSNSAYPAYTEMKRLRPPVEALFILKK